MGAPAVSRPGPAARRASAAPSSRVRPRNAAAAPAAPARRSRPKITPPGGMAMLPVHAVGGAAGAVGGMADSGVVTVMTRGRLWIAVLGLLLGGIVALNVWGLSISAATGGTSTKIDDLERANTVLSTKIAKRTAADRVQTLATGLGLQIPTPKAVNYIKAGSSDAAQAAKRLDSGQISVLAGLPIAPAFADASLAGADIGAPPAEAAATAVPAPAADPAVAPEVAPVVVPGATASPETAPAPATPAPAAPASSGASNGGVAP